MMKQLEIENLHQKMIFYETFKHKFDVKKMETERLLHRVEELSHINGTLEDKIQKQNNKNFRLQRDIDDLKDKIKLLRNNIGGGNDLEELDESRDFKNPDQVKIDVKGISRLNSKKVSPLELSLEEQKSVLSNDRNESLSHELYE